MDNMTREERAIQIWPLLTLAASLRMTLTYKRLGQLIGAGPMSLGGWMEPIQSYCLLHELPPLTVLVVSDSDGMPGRGFVAADPAAVPEAQTKVFRHDWTSTPPPKPEELAHAVAVRPSNGIRSARQEETP
jgi:hypothetical protein